MASFSKRTYVSWRCLCGSDPSLNASFSDEASAQARMQELARLGHGGLKVKKTSSVGWQARVRRKGMPDLTKTFPRRELADQWATEKEGEIVKRQFIDYREAERSTLGDLLAKYDLTRLAGKPKHDPDRARVNMIRQATIAGMKMSILQPSDFAAYRDERCKQVKGATVKKELELMCRVIGLARREWKLHLAVNPVSGSLVARPAEEVGDVRDRRLQERHIPLASDCHESAPASPLTLSSSRRIRKDVEYENDPDTAEILRMPQSEQQALFRACRYPHWYTPRKRHVTNATVKARIKRSLKAPVKARLRPGRRIWALVSMAIETAMRRGEMLKLRWSHVHLDKGYLDLPGHITKNGKPRLVPLSLRAMRILAVQPRTGDVVFPINANTVKLGFKRARERVGSMDLRLHDLRHEATSRLFERTDLRETEIGFVTGHTDPRMLQC